MFSIRAGLSEVFCFPSLSASFRFRFLSSHGTSHRVSSTLLFLFWAVFSVLLLVTWAGVAWKQDMVVVCFLLLSLASLWGRYCHPGYSRWWLFSSPVPSSPVILSPAFILSTPSRIAYKLFCFCFLSIAAMGSLQCSMVVVLVSLLPVESGFHSVGERRRDSRWSSVPLQWQLLFPFSSYASQGTLYLNISKLFYNHLVESVEKPTWR